MKPKFKSILAIASGTAVALLTGCAASMNPIGEAKFDCNRKQDATSQYCRSFKAVEASTAADVPASRFDKEFKLSDLDKLTGISPDEPGKASANAGALTPGSRTVVVGTAPPAVASPGLLPHQTHEEPPLDGMPVRQGPIIQRVWIKRFIDGRDVLTENTVVYREIQATRWAGFDAANGQQTVTAQNYPHRAAEIQPNLTLQRQATEPKPTQSTEFKQPGTSVEAAESAPVPAVSGTNFTMPK